MLVSEHHPPIETVLLYQLIVVLTHFCHVFPVTTAANKPSESVMIPMALMVAIVARGWGVWRC